MPIASKNAQKRLFELLVSERVAEWINGAVEVAQPVGDVINNWLNARLAEAHDHRQHMPGCPAENKRSEDDCNGAQSLARSVLVPRHRRRCCRRARRRVVVSPSTAHL